LQGTLPQLFMVVAMMQFRHMRMIMDQPYMSVHVCMQLF